MGKQKMKKTNIIRDAMTGNPIRPNQEAILVKNIVIYARKLGYMISDYRFLIFVMAIVLLSINVSAIEVNVTEQQEYFQVEFNIFTGIIYLVLFVICGILVYVGRSEIAGIIIILLGFALLFSGFTMIISFLVISLGVAIIFIK